MNNADKELWLKYAQKIKQVEAGEAFIAPIKLNEPLFDVLDVHTHDQAGLWNEIMAMCGVAKKIREKVRKTNANFESKLDG